MFLLLSSVLALTVVNNDNNLGGLSYEYTEKVHYDGGLLKVRFKNSNSFGSVALSLPITGLNPVAYRSTAKDVSVSPYNPYFTSKNLGDSQGITFLSGFYSTSQDFVVNIPMTVSQGIMAVTITVDAGGQLKQKDITITFVDNTIYQNNDESAFTNGCSNSADEDLDYHINCADSDCVGEIGGTKGYGGGTAYCEATETTCNDGFDNDGDNTIDCGDANCKNSKSQGHPTLNLYCDTTENTDTLCSDRWDNDAYNPGPSTNNYLLTTTSSETFDCKQQSCNDKNGSINYKCNYNTETNCTDTYDNDWNNLADCADTNACHGRNLGCLATERWLVNGFYQDTLEYNCTNGLDDDKDLSFFNSKVYPQDKTKIGNDEIDYDCYGEYYIDKTGVPRDKQYVLSNNPGGMGIGDNWLKEGVLDPGECNDGIDNDLDAYVIDPTKFSNNGLLIDLPNTINYIARPDTEIESYGIDCADSDCEGVGLCAGELVFPPDMCTPGINNCENDLDDDGDGSADGADPDCDFKSCGPYPDQENYTFKSCSDSKTNDGDGTTDCADLDCNGEIGSWYGAGACGATQNTEWTCTDNLDNDGGGRDVYDGGCASFFETEGYNTCVSDENGNKYTYLKERYSSAINVGCENSGCSTYCSYPNLVSGNIVPSTQNSLTLDNKGSGVKLDYNNAYYLTTDYLFSVTFTTTLDSSNLQLGGLAPNYSPFPFDCTSNDFQIKSGGSFIPLAGSQTVNGITVTCDANLNRLRFVATSQISSGTKLEFKILSSSVSSGSFQLLGDFYLSGTKIGIDKSSTTGYVRSFNGYEKIPPTLSKIYFEPGNMITTTSGGKVKVPYGSSYKIFINAFDASGIKTCSVDSTSKSSGSCFLEFTQYSDSLNSSDIEVIDKYGSATKWTGVTFNVNVAPWVSAFDLDTYYYKGNVNLLVSAQGGSGSNVDCELQIFSLDDLSKTMTTKDCSPGSNVLTLSSQAYSLGDLKDGLYFARLKLTEGGDEYISLRRAFMVCNDLNSKGSNNGYNWDCRKADFDQDGYTDGVLNNWLLVPGGQGTVGSEYGLTCDNAVGTPNPNQLDTDMDGVGDVIDNNNDLWNPDQVPREPAICGSPLEKEMQPIISFVFSGPSNVTSIYYGAASSSVTSLKKIEWTLENFEGKWKFSLPVITFFYNLLDNLNTPENPFWPGYIETISVDGFRDTALGGIILRGGEQ